METSRMQAKTEVGTKISKSWSHIPWGHWRSRAHSYLSIYTNLYIILKGEFICPPFTYLLSQHIWKYEDNTHQNPSQLHLLDNILICCLIVHIIRITPFNIKIYNRNHVPAFICQLLRHLLCLDSRQARILPHPCPTMKNASTILASLIQSV